MDEWMQKSFLYIYCYLSFLLWKLLHTFFHFVVETSFKPQNVRLLQERCAIIFHSFIFYTIPINHLFFVFSIIF